MHLRNLHPVAREGRPRNASLSCVVHDKGIVKREQQWHEAPCHLNHLIGVSSFDTESVKAPRRTTLVFIVLLV